MVQAVLDERRPWACGCGWILLFLMHALEPRGCHEVPGMLVFDAAAFGFLALVNTGGAQMAARRFAKRPVLPVARINR